MYAAFGRVTPREGAKGGRTIDNTDGFTVPANNLTAE